MGTVMERGKSKTRPHQEILTNIKQVIRLILIVVEKCSGSVGEGLEGPSDNLIDPV